MTKSLAGSHQFCVAIGSGRHSLSDSISEPRLQLIRVGFTHASKQCLVTNLYWAVPIVHRQHWRLCCPRCYHTLSPRDDCCRSPHVPQLQWCLLAVWCLPECKWFQCTSHQHLHRVYSCVFPVFYEDNRWVWPLFQYTGHHPAISDQLHWWNQKSEV
jgi:hypothetical protein